MENLRGLKKADYNRITVHNRTNYDSNEFALKNQNNFTSPAEAKFSNYKNRFKIIKKGFRYKKNRKIAEAYFIRVQKPSLNDQWDHKAFKLF